MTLSKNFLLGSKILHFWEIFHPKTGCALLMRYSRNRKKIFRRGVAVAKAAIQYT